MVDFKPALYPLPIPNIRQILSILRNQDNLPFASSFYSPYSTPFSIYLFDFMFFLYFLEAVVFEALITKRCAVRGERCAVRGMSQYQSYKG